MDHEKYFLNSIQNKNYSVLTSFNFFMNSLAPQTLCPFAAHALFPYVFSFNKGSWFRWMKEKNTVFAQCPNPAVNLTFKITKNYHNYISAEVINKKVSCLAGHKIGDVFELAEVNSNNLNYDLCYINKIESLTVSIVSHSRLCRYYSKPGRIVPFSNLAPKGFCLAAYQTAYPYALSLLYDGHNFKKLGKEFAADISCTNSPNHIDMQIKTKRNIFSPFLNLIEKILRIFHIPKDVLDKKIEINTKKPSGVCFKGINEGLKINFNLRNKNELCPAVFYSIFPYLAMLDKRIFPYWLKDSKSINIHCPDPGANIVYRLSIRG
ncbi:MAG: hypothetical protein NTX01_02265 [Candidatus Omnitrophica bacterium]|nr:hypothetical protein [Candidatus Omnitrophota bacterium]